MPGFSFFISLGLSIVSSISKSSFDTKARKQEPSFSLFTPFKILLLKKKYKIKYFFFFPHELCFEDCLWKGVVLAFSFACVLFFFFLVPHVRNLILWPGIEPRPQQWKHWVLTTGLPGSFQTWAFSLPFPNTVCCGSLWGRFPWHTFRLQVSNPWWPPRAFAYAEFALVFLLKLFTISFH